MKIKLLFTILISLSLMDTYGQDEKINIKDVVLAANKGLASYLEKIPKGKENWYGFKNRNEFAIAKLGKPYQITTLSKEFYTDKQLSSKNYVVPTGECRVPIIVNGQYRALLTVGFMNGVWKVVGLGAAGLAKDIGEFEKKYPSSNKSGTLLNIIDLQVDFILYTQNNSSDLQAYPLSSARTAQFYSKEKNSLKTLSQILSVIKK